MRDCGGCTACCKATRVPELNKPEGVLCANCTGSGCAIYETRPSSCAAFMCQWLAGDMSESMRPDLSGVVIERLPTSGHTVIALTEDGTTPIPQEIVSFYTGSGMAIAALGKRMFLPEGMTQMDVRNDLFRASAMLGV